VRCGLYREGLTSDSAIYQFLCFYKIIEALSGIAEDVPLVLQT
jgi:hypothetical protein